MWGLQNFEIILAVSISYMIYRAGQFLFKSTINPLKERLSSQKIFTCSKSTIETFKKSEIMLKVHTTVTRTMSMTCLLWINVDLVVLLITLRGIYPQDMQDTSPYCRGRYIFKVLELFQKVDTNCMKIRLSLSIWVNTVNSDANWMSELKILKQTQRYVSTLVVHAYNHYAYN